MQTVLILSATFVGLMAALLGVASTVARKTSDPSDRRAATNAAFWSLVVFTLCIAVIASLSGCSTIVKCMARDGTSRPCN